MIEVKIAFSHKVLGLHVYQFLVLKFEKNGDAQVPMDPALLDAW